jgi:hypothetical protein
VQRTVPVQQSLVRAASAGTCTWFDVSIQNIDGLLSPETLVEDVCYDSSEEGHNLALPVGCLAQVQQGEVQEQS